MAGFGKHSGCCRPMVTGSTMVKLILLSIGVVTYHEQYYRCCTLGAAKFFSNVVRKFSLTWPRFLLMIFIRMVLFGVRMQSLYIDDAVHFQVTPNSYNNVPEVAAGTPL